MEDNQSDTESPKQGSSQQQPRSAPSPGDMQQTKRTKSTPTPGPVARVAGKWIRHTLDLASTRKNFMPAETVRNLFVRLDELETAVTDLVIENHQLRSQVEEARRSAEICVGAAASQFGTELRLRDAAHEQTMEAIITRYAEKEAVRIHELAAAVAPGPVVQDQVENVGVATFAAVTRRKVARSTDRAVDRSRSRATQRNRKLKEGRQAEHMPSFVLQETEGKTMTDVRDMVWN
ncbi:unnamed protein product [Macrosiphum euphorbiae]|uniref:Uncharacterized protein n=1 Tax=Macrosiphum euphorbiae TaxID=13131 RepID=A0AAV0XQ83_9HEMI|nr:unnamed protein product [Macrosiphum euphorbiae]